MKILYKDCVSNINILGYFSDVQVILDSLRITYSSLKELNIIMETGRIYIISEDKLMETYVVQEGFICDKADHL